MALLVGYTTTFSSPAAHARAASFATAKALSPAWHVVFLRGVGANWLVCLAAWLSFMARGFGGKVAAIWGPTFAFVMLGFDHVVANMLYVPLGIFVGAEGLTVGRYIADSMIPALLGNIVGGGLMVGVVYWYLVSCPVFGRGCWGFDVRRVLTLSVFSISAAMRRLLSLMVKCGRVIRRRRRLWARCVRGRILKVRGLGSNRRGGRRARVRKIWFDGGFAQSIDQMGITGLALVRVKKKRLMIDLINTCVER